MTFGRVAEALLWALLGLVGWPKLVIFFFLFFGLCVAIPSLR